MCAQRRLDEIEVQIKKVQDCKKRHQKVKLLTSPLITLTTLPWVLQTLFIHLVKYLQKNIRAVFAYLAIVFLGVVFYYLPGAHQYHVDIAEEYFLFCVWWIGLGVLSSVGLGTGLHTFVLYLGPHIAKVTLTATECNSIDFETSGPESFMCPPNVDPTAHITYLDILGKVQLAALMWGIGTALGELPPYFVARAARLSGMRNEDPNEVEEDGRLNRIKNVLINLVNRLGFFGILLFASIPNPLFDLAGVMCGHLLKPFWSFFGATLIGKAFIKAHIQTIFVITVFHKEHLAAIVDLIEAWLPFLKNKIHPILEKERARLHRTDGAHVVVGGKSTLAFIWDCVLVLMLLYFVISIVDSSVQDYLMSKDDEELERLKAEKKKLGKSD
eukprot:TRINITY_DN5568_c0_g3_i1.p1 TRINITY_DN5568_c0_g3~~TRINITY_DN5568_c0_g3_i1.p1  ORF type:complete len:385 (+),score=73.34 TRINITY_DN5568_c0_g3_i1:280-1434(+)